MKLSWNNIKISIAGARLSHLVQKNKVWDHGSMVEQVRTVFIYLKKAFLKNDLTVVKKCMTPEGYKQIRKDGKLLLMLNWYRSKLFLLFLQSMTILINSKH
jgi:hypothetical protein